VRAPWRVVADTVEVVCPASWEGRGRALGAVLQDLSEGSWGSSSMASARVFLNLRGGSSWGCRRRGLRPLGAVVAAGAEGLTEGSAEAFREGSSRSLPWVSRGLPHVVVEGHGGHLPGLCDEHHKGAPGGAFERPLLGVFGGYLGVRQGSRYGGRGAVGSGSRNVVLSVCRASHRRVTSGPHCDLRKSHFRPARQGAAVALRGSVTVV
jgi:hypothetical protein